jgi:hypothetical protein
MVDDGLASQRRIDAVAAVTLHTGSLHEMRNLPRDAAIRSGWGPLWRRVRDCGRAVRLELAAFAWPELLGQWIDEAADLSAEAELLVVSVRNIGFAARSVSLRNLRASVGFAEASVVDRGKPAAEAMLDALFASRKSGRRPQRHTAWGKGALRPYNVGPRGLSIVGVALGERSRAWRLRQPRASRGAGQLGRLSADGAALLRQLAPDLPPSLAAISKAAASRVGSIRGDLSLSRTRVALELDIKIR